MAAYSGRNIQIIDGRIVSDEQLLEGTIPLFSPFSNGEEVLDSNEAY